MSEYTSYVLKCGAGLNGKHLVEFYGPGTMCDEVHNFTYGSLITRIVKLQARGADTSVEEHAIRTLNGMGVCG